MGIFGGDKSEKRVQDAEAKAEADRLSELAVPAIAAEILPAFGPEGPGKGGKEIGAFQVGMFLMREFPRGSSNIKELLHPIREGIQALEGAGLVERRVRSIGGATVSVTRAGTAAIESGNGAELLGVAAA